jgi:uncharacterized protein (TIGR00725 family)
MTRPRRYVAVSGPSAASEAEVDQARTAGRMLAERGLVVLTGGLGGVMAAAAAGAADAGGTTVALLPGSARADASPGHQIVIPTGMGEMRNTLLVRSADAVLAIGGSWGTLSEVALAARAGLPVCAVGGWDLPGDVVLGCATVEEAVTALGSALGL